ncbi:hypothetical protein CV014_10680 [Nostoc sp. CMAA1605]|nr:hypothetical protein [Nostoc sp. CMAA1605]
MTKAKVKRKKEKDVFPFDFYLLTYCKGGFPHLMVRLAPLVCGQAFFVVRSTIVKETAKFVSHKSQLLFSDSQMQ